ncbi:angiotensin-converting enzyme [Procambarus clarkii]|uniref:angiotensin-converting enzyme n=1 Tax=Procambarus clarkii TaxID=6728 RepID=UPI0037447F3B
MLSQWQHHLSLPDAEEEATLPHDQWQKEMWQAAQVFKEHLGELPGHLTRQFQLLSILGTAALPDDELAKIRAIKSKMLDIYNTAKTCDFKNSTRCDLSLKPELTQIMQESRDYEVLTQAWQAWRDSSGRKMNGLYREYTQLANEAAKLNGFNNMAEMWLIEYNETGTFMDNVADSYKQLMPLYKQLHAYVRRKLREVYGAERVTARGPIPAHLLGNMWAQRWDHIYHLVAPYPARKSLDVTQQMRKLGYTPKMMLEVADDFFASMNLTRLPEAFWQHSILEKPANSLCHSSSWDFCNGKDYRITMCTEVSMSNLISIHHAMGRTQYQMQYKHLPLVFRGSANPGFGEAVSHVLSMSLSTQTHLKKIGLLSHLKEDREAEINFLLKIALNKIAFLPFAFLADMWRWDVFNGDIPHTHWNCAWWQLRFQLQGMKPPVPRSEEDFDPGAMYEVAAGVDYIRYFVAHVLQFQIHRALCIIAGEYNPLHSSKPLHECDLYHSTEAGNALRAMMQLGKSKPWPEALEAVTGQREMNASALTEYFRPLQEWLTKNNQKHGEFIGWEADGDNCSDPCVCD